MQGQIVIGWRITFNHGCKSAGMLLKGLCYSGLIFKFEFELRGVLIRALNINVYKCL